jgi:hypothetical protein
MLKLFHNGYPQQKNLPFLRKGEPDWRVWGSHPRPARVVDLSLKMIEHINEELLVPIEAEL